MLRRDADRNSCRQVKVSRTSSDRVTALAAGIAAVAALGWVPGLIEAGIDVAIAAACAAAAGIAGQVAGDPPVPDVRNRSLIEPISVGSPDDERLAPLSEFLDGARGASRSRAKQVEHFKAIRAELPKLQKEVRRRLPAAAKWLADHGQLQALRRFDGATARLSRDLAFRAQMQKHWAAAGGDVSSFAAAQQLLACRR